MKIPLRRLVPLLLGLFLTACARPPAMGRGVRFGFRADDRELGPTSGNVVIVPRANATLDVFESRTLREGADIVAASDVDFVPILSAESSNTDVVQVLGTELHAISIRSGRPGTATLHVRSSAWAHDLPVVVAEPSRVDLAYSSPDLERPITTLVIVRGGIARVRLRRTDTMGRVLGGSEHSPSVFVEPRGAGAVTMRNGDRDSADLQITVLGHAVLRTPGGSPVTVEAVESTAVTSLETVRVVAPGHIEPLETVHTDEHPLVVVRATDAEGTRIVGLTGVATLASQTVDTCTVQDVSRWYTDGAYIVTARAPGGCDLVATLGNVSAVTHLSIVE